MTPEKDITLKVTGMSCGSCVRHVTQALQELEGVRTVDVSLQEGTAQVRYDANRVSEAAMVKALDDAGYDAAAIAPG